MKKLLFTLTSMMALSQAAYADTFIRHNLAGYFPAREKVAVVMSDADLQGKKWSVSKDGVPVLSGTFSSKVTGKSKFTALDYNYEIDFSALSSLGDFTLTVPGATPANISVKNNPYGHIANEMLRILRVRRSGTTDTLDHQISHLGDAQAPYYRIDGAVENGQWKADDTGKKADMLGGWYDAGDYIKFTLTIAQTTNVLLEAYQANPDIFIKTHSKSQYVDMLDEIKFGLDYLMKTMPDNDEFIIQLSTGLDHVGLPNWRLPENDLRDGQREALSALSPSHMAITAAALAHGAAVFQIFDANLAAQYQAKAIAIYKRSMQNDVLSQNAFERDAKNDFYLDESINNDRALAATRLFELTGDTAYKNEAINFANTHGAFVYDNKEYYSGLDYYFSETDSILMTYKALGKVDNTSMHMGKIELDTHLEYANAKGNIWSTAQIPDWGNLANMLYVTGTVAEDLVNYGDSYYNSMAFNNIDYMLGRNPWGMSFVNATGLSKVPTQYHSQIYHLQPEKNPLGVMVNGPSKPKYVKADPDIKIAVDAWEHQFNTSDMVDGVDEGINFFDNWTNYTGTEPTIFGQATGIYAIAALARLEKEGIAKPPTNGARPAMKSVPNGLDVNNVPMFVTISSDDNSKVSGVKWLADLVNNTTNPIGSNNPFTLDGQKAKMTFLNTGAYVGAVGAQWKSAYDAGNEMGNHTQTHNGGGVGYEMSYAAWLNEITTSNANIVSTGIPRDQIFGFRSPRLEYNNAVINVVKDEGFLYDTSIEDGWATGLDGSNYHWPYTLDAGSPGAIHKTTWDKAGGVPFLIGNYNGLWEIPVSPWIVPADDEDGLPYDLRAKIKANMPYFDMASGKITAFDYNLLVSAKLNDANDIFAIWKHSLDLRLQGNRAPLTIGIHAQNYQSATSPAAIALKRFVEYAASQTDVRLASHKQVVDWLENPRALDDIPNIIQASITPHTVTGQCTNTPWLASETYQEGDKVTYQDQTWTAGWYNSNSAPGSSQWGPWGDSGVSCNGTETLYYGTMMPSVGAVAVEDHQAETFTFSPDNGKKLLQVTVDGVVVLPLPINGYSFSDVTGDHVIEATFGDDLATSYVVTASSGQHGSISPSGAVNVVEGKNQLFNFVPDANYKVQFVKVNGAEVQVINNQYEVQNVTANTTIAVTFVADDINPVTYTLSASAGLNGTISPIGDSQVNAGSSLLYTFTADSGYQLDVVTVDGVAVTVVNDQYLLENVSANTSIFANFKPVDTNTCKEAWDASPGYPKGSVVSYEGYNWTAKWWSKNEVPVDQPWGNPWQKNTQPCG